MVIRRSSTREVQGLVADVLSDAALDGGVRREAAVARLRVIGDRAVRQVVSALGSAESSDARVALLRVLEGRRDMAVAAVAAHAMDAPETEVRAAAVLVARGLLDEPEGAALLGRLAAVAVAGAEAREVRIAAVAALAALPGDAAMPVLRQLSSDPDPAIRLAASPRGPADADEPGVDIEEAASGRLPADPGRLLDALARDGAVVPLSTLHRLVMVVRGREGSQKKDAARRDWLTVRGAVHRALAVRGSRVALYDLRETLESAANPLPEGFTDALAGIGDGACLDPIAARYSDARDQAWQAALAAAAAAIASRERLTARSAVVKRLRARHGDEVTRRLIGLPA